MPRILISYRRADSDAIAGRIRDQLASRYGSNSVFMDIDNVPFGVDFREQIKSEIDKDDVVLAIIGPRWRGPRRGARARINDADDFVRVELETALGRPIPVVPVLVNGMKMPKPDDLPDGLKKLSFHNAAVVDGGQDFHQHVDRLIRSIDRMLGIKRNLWKWMTVGVGTVATIVVIWAGWFYRHTIFPNNEARVEIIFQNVIRTAYARSLDFGTLFGPGSSSAVRQSDWNLALLKPVDLPIFNVFVDRGYSRELLFWLFLVSVREDVPEFPIIEFLNDLDPALACQVIHEVQRCFRDMVDVAIASGLTVETRRISGRTAARLCFDDVLAARAAVEYNPEIRQFLLSAEHRPRCKYIDPWSDTATDIL